MKKKPPKIQSEHYYSDGDEVRYATNVSDEYVAYHEARLTATVTGAPTVVKVDEFQQWALYEVIPMWVKKGNEKAPWKAKLKQEIRTLVGRLGGLSAANKRLRDRLDVQHAKGNIKHKGTDDLTCPWCGDDTYYGCDEVPYPNCEYTCRACGKKYSATSEDFSLFSTKKVED